MQRSVQCPRIDPLPDDLASGWPTANVDLEVHDRRTKRCGRIHRTTDPTSAQQVARRRPVAGLARYGEDGRGILGLEDEPVEAGRRRAAAASAERGAWSAAVDSLAELPAPRPHVAYTLRQGTLA